MAAQMTNVVADSRMRYCDTRVGGKGRREEQSPTTPAETQYSHRSVAPSDPIDSRPGDESRDGGDEQQPGRYR